MSDPIDDYLQFRSLAFHAVDTWTRDIADGHLHDVAEEIHDLPGRARGFLPREQLLCAVQRLGANLNRQRRALAILDGDDDPADKVRRVRVFLNLMAPADTPDSIAFFDRPDEDTQP